MSADLTEARVPLGRWFESSRPDQLRFFRPSAAKLCLEARVALTRILVRTEGLLSEAPAQTLASAGKLLETIGARVFAPSSQ